MFLTALLSYAAADFPHGHGETLLATENSQPVKNVRQGVHGDIETPALRAEEKQPSTTRAVAC
jgi:hypothetical protein